MCAMTKKKQPNAKDARGKSWVPGQKDQDGEGLGGSAGQGTGASGPESRKRSKQKDETDYSPSLPSREKIAKVLR